MDLVVNNLPTNAGDAGSIPRMGRSSGEGNGNPLQYSCLENPMDRGPGGLQSMQVAESGTRLKLPSMHAWEQSHLSSSTKNLFLHPWFCLGMCVQHSCGLVSSSVCLAPHRTPSSVYPFTQPLSPLLVPAEFHLSCCSCECE